ncbi:MAG: hypothetical protein GY863_14795 [bacterium]|nr:hypothetical protein [bacterium]
MKNKEHILLLLVFVFASGLVGCTEEPTIFESGNLPFIENPNLVTTGVAFYDTSLVFWDPLNAGVSLSLLMGEFENQNTKILMQFDNIRENVEVISAKIRLTPKHLFGIPSGELMGEVREVEFFWNEELIYVDSLRYSDLPISTFTVNPSLDMADEIEIPVSIVEKWIAAQSDTNIANYGVLLEVPDGTYAKQYYAGDDPSGETGRPYLVLEFADQDSTVEYLPSEDTYLIEIKESYDYNFYASNLGENSIVVFNLRDIPISATVNHVELLMVIDEERSVKGIEDNYELNIAMVQSPFGITAPGLLDLTEIGRIESLIPTDSSTVTFSSDQNPDFSKVVQSWVTNPQVNYGMILYTSNQLVDYSRFSFVKDDPILENRCRLIVKYTLFNNK